MCVRKKRFEDTKEVIRGRKSKDRQYNGQKKNAKGTNNDLQNIIIESKRSSNTKKLGQTQVLRKGKQFLFLLWVSTLTCVYVFKNFFWTFETVSTVWYFLFVILFKYILLLKLV